MTKIQQQQHHLYIDGDMLVYKLGYASETRIKFIDGSKFSKADLTLCKRLVKAAIVSYCKRLNSSVYTIVLSGSGNYRTQFFPKYKENRVELIKPLCYSEIRSYISSLPETVVVDGEEADDYLASKMTELGENCLVVSADKDFFTVPHSLLFNISTSRIFKTSLSQAFSFLFFQALAGDRVDGYYGVKWLGTAKVWRILQACHKKTIRQTYLFIKNQVLLRGKTVEERRGNWKDFRLCLDLAALRWNGEVGALGIGIKRVFKYRTHPFEYYLPYYDVHHNVKFGVEVK